MMQLLACSLHRPGFASACFEAVPLNCHAHAAAGVRRMRAWRRRPPLCIITTGTISTRWMLRQMRTPDITSVAPCMQ